MSPEEQQYFEVDPNLFLETRRTPGRKKSLELVSRLCPAGPQLSPTAALPKMNALSGALSGKS